MAVKADYVSTVMSISEITVVGKCIYTTRGTLQNVKEKKVGEKRNGGFS